jgi:hypothetical protein
LISQGNPQGFRSTTMTASTTLEGMDQSPGQHSGGVNTAEGHHKRRIENQNYLKKTVIRSLPLIQLARLKRSSITTKRVNPSKQQQ